MLFSTYAVLRESSDSSPVTTDIADRDPYVAGIAISWQLPRLLCIRRKQKTILCRGLVTEEMTDCIVHDLEEELRDELFKFTRHVICGDKKSSAMASSTKWKT